jgi:hypothetical protein
MSMSSKKSVGWAFILVLLGLVAMFAGATSLIAIVPAAALVWYGARPAMRSGRN